MAKGHLAPLSLLLLATVAVTQLLPVAHALSSPLCSNGGQAWVTQYPYRNAAFPGADLFFVCSSGLNVLGDSLDPCLNQGSLCTQAATDAICKFLGYDFADGASTSVRAQANETVRTLTGEYCLREGTYSKSLPANLATMPGTPCLHIDAITCVRTQQHISESLQSIVMDATTARKAPQSSAPATMPTSSDNITAAGGPDDRASTGGRKMKL